MISNHAITIIGLIAIFTQAHGRGYLADPPSRSSSWRLGYNTPKNYDDSGLNCGDWTDQWVNNKGKCGICGDPYEGPLNNELPDGLYAKPLVITGNYTAGQTVGIKLVITSVKRGYFQFRLCPATTQATEVSQECLDQHLLQVLNSTDPTKFTELKSSVVNYTVPVQLPAGLKCDRCVIQWTYTTGNRWGKCPDGHEAEGCGPQETYRGCADVAIH